MISRSAPLAGVLTAVGSGAVLGAWLRWLLSDRYNATIDWLPLGTLAVNVIGGYFVGVAVAYFSAHPALSPLWRLFIITGFLGGLTTFSSFSAEAVALLLTAQWRLAFVHAASHLAGSIVATILGIWTVRLLR